MPLINIGGSAFGEEAKTGVNCCAKWDYVKIRTGRPEIWFNHKRRAEAQSNPAKI